MKDPLVPKDGDRFLLCHRCQFYMAMAGGVMHFAIDRMDRRAECKPQRLIFRQGRIRTSDETCE